MKVIKKSIITFLVAVSSLLMGCGDNKYENLGNEYVEGYDYQAFFGSMPCVQKVDKGYYYLFNEYLFYYDTSMDQACFVCNKINCNHDNEECNAYLPDADEINYCDDMIYYISSEEDGDSSKYYLFCVSRDGKRKEKVVQIATLDPEDNGISFQMCIHRGKLYFSVLKQTTLKKRNALVYEIDLNGSNTWKEVASIEGYGAMIDDLAAYGNTLVVFGSYADSEDSEFRYHTNLVNLDNNEVKKDILYDKEKDEIFSFMNKDNLYYYSDSKLFSKNINTEEEKCISGNSIFYDEVFYDGNYIYTRNYSECRENNDYSDYRIDIYDLHGEMKGSIPMTEDMSWLHGDEDLFFVEEWTDEKVDIKVYDKTDIIDNKKEWKSILTIQGE